MRFFSSILTAITCALGHRSALLTYRSMLALLALLPAACERGPVEWEDVATAGLLTDPPAQPTASDSTPPLVLPRSACQRSVVFARMGGEEWYAAWWAPRGDGSAALVVARSINGGQTWTVPVTADARDRSARGCARPTPAIAADSASGYVHLAYFLEPANGAGLWLTHSMEQGEMWHAPVGIVYGERPVRASLAVAGDTVIVAYENPNAAVPRVDLAVSRMAGHIIDARTPVSSGSMAALVPRVALRGRRVAVSWTERPVGADSTMPGRLVVRAGLLRS